MKVQASGIPWYKEAEFEEIKSIMEDGDKLHANYADWLKAANKVKESIKRAGIVPVEAYVNPKTFVAWCKARGLNVDANARTQYASFIAYKSYQEGDA